MKKRSTVIWMEKAAKKFQGRLHSSKQKSRGKDEEISFVHDGLPFLYVFADDHDFRFEADAAFGKDLVLYGSHEQQGIAGRCLPAIDDKASVLWGNHGIPHTHTLESCLVDKGRCIVSKGPFEGATGTGVVKRLFGTAPPGKVRHLRFNDLLLFWL